MTRATIIPDKTELATLPTPLTKGEKQLVDALEQVLDSSWTIYVQPHLNGLQPDVLIFSPEAGIGVFEVKDWNLDHYQVNLVNKQKQWQVFDSKQGHWVKMGFDKCPFYQVQHYHESLYRYELTILGAKRIFDNDIHALVKTFVFFSQHTQTEIRKYIGHALSATENPFGFDCLNPKCLKSLLAQHHLQPGSKFANWMKEEDVEGRLRNALVPPAYGKTDLASIEFGLNKKQARFLKNSSGKRDVLGVAGSGKTLLLVRKAVREAQAGKRVLLTCYNITMSNYLRDLTNRLSRSKGPHINRNIVVRHYHRIYPKSGGEIIDWEGKFDVILVDEGQDFKQEWIENLYNLAIGKVHFVLVKDDRQNIYKVDAAQQRTQELKLSRSFRIPKATADVANYLIKWAGYDNKSGDITAYPEQKDLFMPIWCSGNPKSVLMTLEKQLSRLVSDPQTGALADIAILVCNVKDGWRICDILDHLKLPYITNFESRDEDEQVRKSFPGEGEKLKHKIEELRRARKIAFWMQAGRIKVCTIHSFKGWELKRVLIYFRPEEEQINTRVPLLYTAITRSQGSLHIYCADTYLEKFGEVAKQHRLVIAPEI